MPLHRSCVVQSHPKFGNGVSKLYSNNIWPKKLRRRLERLLTSRQGI